MSRLRRSGVVVSVMIFLLAVTAASGGYRKVATNSDPHCLTAQSLRLHLERSGLAIRFIRHVDEPVPSIVGVARRGSEVLGFEFQLFPSSDEATVSRVGRLEAADFSWPPRFHGFLLGRWVRGVIANVAFAEYERNVVEGPRQSVGEAHRAQLDEQELQRAVDDALFSSFPARDPFAHAVSGRP